jgi:membrane-bound lytic murein transglycosylase F
LLLVFCSVVPGLWPGLAPWGGDLASGAAPVLRVAVRPDRAVLPARREALGLEREIARGIAELAGRRLELLVEHDEARMAERLLAGEVDLVARLPMTPDLRERVAFSLPYGVAGSTSAVAVAVRPDAPELRRLANEFLVAHALLGPAGAPRTDDLEGIAARGEIRVLAERGPASYFVHGGESRGFEYELMKRFADEHGLAVRVVVPPARSDLVPWLLEGRGDVIASGFTVTPECARDVAFTRPYRNAQEVIVVREGDEVRDLDDLRGRTVYVLAGTAHSETLRELRQTEDDFDIAFVPEGVPLEEVLALVESGVWDVTVCDSHVLEMERAAGRRLRAAFPIKAVRHAWAVRPGNVELRGALDQFIRSEYRGLDFNVIRRRYFESPRAIASLRGDFRSDVSGRISPYDDLIRRYAGQCGLDWRLVAAVVYEESRFDGDSVSPSGASGLMQLMPSTADELGVGAQSDPESSIHAGTRYLRRLIDRFEPELPLEARIRFALASYNAGQGHVEDARKLAESLGWSPDRWYGSVERALLLLQDPRYYLDSRYGYCRGWETVRYVAQIDRTYRTYVEHVPDALVSVDPVAVPPS